MAAQVEKPRYRTLKVPDPAYLMIRAKQGVRPGVLSRQPRAAFVGQEFLLVNERLKEGEPTKAWGVVKLQPGTAFRDGPTAIRELGAKLDELTQREFAGESGQVWFHPLGVIEAYKEPLPVTRQTPGRRYTGRGTVEKKLSEADKRDIAREDAVIAENKKKPAASARHRFKPAKWTHPNGHPRCIVCGQSERTGGWCNVPGQTAGATKEDVNPTQLADQSTSDLLAMLAVLEREFERRGYDASKSEDLINSARFLLDELARREVKAPDGKLVEAARELVGKAAKLVPVAPSGNKSGRPIKLTEVLRALDGDAVIREGVVTIVGGVANHGQTEHDLDFLVRGPLDEETRRVIEFRVGRALASLDPELADRAQFMDANEMGGPFTNHAKLYDLVLVRRPDPQRKVIEMAAEVEKADDPLMDLVSKPGPRPAVLQAHFRGRSMHLDLRLKMDGHLTGWTLTPQRAGAIPDIDTVEDGRRIVADFDIKGSRTFKPILAPAKIQAIPKTRQPVAWLTARDQVIKPGDVGATAEEEGVLVTVDRPNWEQGVVKPQFHEYFLTGGRHLNGVVFARKIVGEGDEPLWNVWLSKNAMPSILSTRAVSRGDMPPDGRSWIPATLEQATPKELRYWEHKGAEARRIRDELVRSRHFTDANVKIVGGRFRRVVEKWFVAEGPEPVAKAEDGHVPPAAAQSEAKAGLEWRREFGRGGTDVGVARARDIANLRPLSMDTLRRMRSYFARHEVDRKAPGWRRGEPGYPSAGRVAWALWGGDSARAWVERILERVNKAADIRPFVLARQAFKGQQVVREGPTRTRWFLMFPAGGGEMHLLMMDVDPAEEKGQIAAVHQHQRSTDLMELDGPADPGTTVGGYKVNDTKDTPSDWRIVDSGKVAVLEEEPNRWLLNFSGRDIRGHWTAQAEEAGSKLWLLERGKVAPIEKAIPVSDGVQRWDPKRNDPDADRTEMRPLAIFSPQKPSDQNEFNKVEEALGWATPEMLKAGIAVEPKMNGRVVVVERDGDGRVLLYFEDTLRDRAEYFPALSKATKALGRPAIMVGELIDYRDGDPLPRRELARFGQDQVHDDADAKIHVWDVLYWGDRNVTDRPWDERRPFRARAFRDIKGDVFVNVPSRVARTKDELAEAMRWAGRQPGSEGAMLKSVNGTYSLGGQTSSDAKFKAVREIRAIVLDRQTKSPAPSQTTPARTYVYTCGVGQVDNPDDWQHTTEVRGRHYVTIGKTFASNVTAEPGDVLRIEATELLLDTREPRKLTWFTPMVVEKIDGQPMKTADVERLVRPDEITKHFVIKAKHGEYERYVFGLVLEPNDGQGGNPFAPDLQKDTYSAEEIWTAWWNYTTGSRKLGLLHKRPVGDDAMVLLDNYVMPADMTVNGQHFRKGSWVMGALIKDDALWKEALDGTFNGWSIQGSAIRELMRRAA